MNVEVGAEARNAGIEIAQEGKELLQVRYLVKLFMGHYSK
jgi:hypothetical protein